MSDDGLSCWKQINEIKDELSEASWSGACPEQLDSARLSSIQALSKGSGGYVDYLFK